MSSIIAASTGAARQDLRSLARDASYVVSAVAESPPALEYLLRQDSSAWVLTGMDAATARSFVRKAHAVPAAAVVVLRDEADHDDWCEFGGGLAVLRASSPAAVLRAAVGASRAGLSIWDPALDLAGRSDASIDRPLSPRERAVLQLAGAGSSTKAIARRLGISPNTVKFHLQTAFAKLGVSSRAEAVLSAVRRGELSV